jgi:NAD(P)-dependent dehydrogenase (short-subunit alcohol dehydrogenase family)
MTSLNIQLSDIPDLSGKTAIITGGASGIGYAAAQTLSSRGATVHILDLNPPDDGTPANATFTACDVSSWPALRAAFATVGKVDIAIANAGISENQSFFEDRFDEDGQLAEPDLKVVDVNYKAVVNFTKLAVHNMRTHGTKGSIVITASATAYAPEQNLPVYSGTKLGVSYHHNGKGKMTS